MDLSLIIACYNEQSHLERNLQEIRSTLELCPWDFELILIDDASQDETPELIENFVASEPRARSVLHAENVGRGGTVAEGLRLARGSVAGYIDLDLEVHCRYVPSLVQAIFSDRCDVATALRVYKVNLTPSGVLRWILSAGYRIVARTALASPFADTETGFKFFRREAILPVLDRCEQRGWFWDTEVMLEAKAAGLRVLEIPALFQRQPAATSSLRVLPDTLGYLRAIAAYRRKRRGNV